MWTGALQQRTITAVAILKHDAIAAIISENIIAQPLPTVKTQGK